MEGQMMITQCLSHAQCSVNIHTKLIFLKLKPRECVHLFKEV